MFDFVIQNGTVIDGSGGAPRRADVAVEAGRVAAGDALGAGEARERIDAAGRVISPGFIDMHTHSDLALLINPEAHSKIRQGVTTEVIGNCGSSPAPYTGPMAEQIRLKMSASSPQELADWSWTSYGEYLTRLEAGGTALNVVGLVGHVSLR